MVLCVCVQEGGDLLGVRSSCVCLDRLQQWMQEIVLHRETLHTDCESPRPPIRIRFFHYIVDIDIVCGVLSIMYIVLIVFCGAIRY